MRRFAGLERPGITAINVVPIIDVALVLVIILMMTAPMLATPSLELDLPQARSQAAGSEPHVNVTIALDGRVAIDDSVVTRETFRRDLSARFVQEDMTEPLVVVRADAGIPHGWVRELLLDARSAGASRIAIATRPPSQETP